MTEELQENPLPEPPAQSKSNALGLKILMLFILIFGILLAFGFYKIMQMQENTLAQMSDLQQTFTEKSQQLEQENKFLQSELLQMQQDKIIFSQQLISMAELQLKYLYNISSAIALLNMAETHLAPIKAAKPLQEAISELRQSLEKIPTYPDLFSRIQSLAEQIKGLTFTFPRAPSLPVTQAAHSSFLDQTIQSLKEIVVIRRVELPLKPLMTQEQQGVFKASLMLMVEQINLALLEKNDQLYHQSLQSLQTWLNHFAVYSTEIPEINKEITELLKIQLRAPLPDFAPARTLAQGLIITPAKVIP